jgi:signal transduction histidine kinase
MEREWLRIGPQNGFGLAGMRERILAVGGEFNIDSSPGKGTRIGILLLLNQYEKSQHLF